MTRPGSRTARAVAKLATGVFLLAACSGSDGASTDTTLSAPRSSETAVSASPASPSTTVAISTAPTPSIAVINGSADPTTVEWRNRLLDIGLGFHRASADCFADPQRCAATFDTTLGEYLTGAAATEVRAKLDSRLADGIFVRDVPTIYYQGYVLYAEAPVDAALSLCVVDKAVQYVPASGAASEKIVDDSQVTYFEVYRMTGDQAGVIRISQIGATGMVPLEGEYGQCDQYAR